LALNHCIAGTQISRKIVLKLAKYGKKNLERQFILHIMCFFIVFYFGDGNWRQADA